MDLIPNAAGTYARAQCSKNINSWSQNNCEDLFLGQSIESYKYQSLREDSKLISNKNQLKNILSSISEEVIIGVPIINTRDTTTLNPSSNTLILAVDKVKFYLNMENLKFQEVWSSIKCQLSTKKIFLLRREEYFNL